MLLGSRNNPSEHLGVSSLGSFLGCCEGLPGSNFRAKYEACCKRILKAAFCEVPGVASVFEIS